MTVIRYNAPNSVELQNCPACSPWQAVCRVTYFALKINIIICIPPHYSYLALDRRQPISDYGGHAEVPRGSGERIFLVASWWGGQDRQQHTQNRAHSERPPPFTGVA